MWIFAREKWRCEVGRRDIFPLRWSESRLVRTGYVWYVRRMKTRVRRTSLGFLIACVTGSGLCGMPVTAQIPGLGGADGFYKPSSVEGSVRFAGRNYKLPLEALRKALLEKGVVPVVSNKIPVKHFEWEKLIEKFEFRDIDGKATASGPSNIVFTQKGERFVGRAKKPLVIRQKGKYRFVTVTLLMRTHLQTEVKGDKLTMSSPIEIKVLGLTSKGSIRMEATKIEGPPFPP
jgi:hypothetical protein